MRPIAWAGLIAVELGLAVAVGLGSEPAAYLAAGLMLLFAALTAARSCAVGQAPPCAVLRSSLEGLLARGAAQSRAGGGFRRDPAGRSVALSTDAWLGIAAGVALRRLCGLAVAVLALAREVGMLRLQIGTQGALEIAGEGPDVGSPAEALAADGGAPPAARNGSASAVFSSEGCHLCQTLSPAIENVANDPHVTVGVFDEAPTPPSGASSRSQAARSRSPRRGRHRPRQGHLQQPRAARERPGDRGAAQNSGDWQSA